MSQLFPVTKEEKIAELKREIDMRLRVFKRKVDEKSMSASSADRRIEVMRAILNDYETGAAR